VWFFCAPHRISGAATLPHLVTHDGVDHGAVDAQVDCGDAALGARTGQGDMSDKAGLGLASYTKYCADCPQSRTIWTITVSIMQLTGAFYAQAARRRGVVSGDALPALGPARHTMVGMQIACRTARTHTSKGRLLFVICRFLNTLNMELRR